MNGAVSARLPDGRLHLQHGPIDLVILATEVEYGRATRRFATVLEELVRELALLRTPIGEAYPLARGEIARRMVAAVWPHRARFITPMAAVAGAVADEMLEAMQPSGKAYVNNGGDIAVHLPRGMTFDAGVVNNPQRPMVDATIRLEEPCGIATSGWRGRSQSLGIADAVTVVADCGAVADAAATMIANAVNAEHPAIRRLPARAVKEDSDLGELPVTVDVGPLPLALVRAALDAGREVAAAMRACGFIRAAYLSLQNQTTTVVPQVHFASQRRSP
jgi:uncharacterized protein